MPHVPQLLGAQGRPPSRKQIQFGYVSYHHTPTAFTDDLLVIIPEFSYEHYWRVKADSWGAIHGGTLPAAGAECLLIWDDQDNLRCPWWAGTFTEWPTSETAAKT